MEKCCDDDEFHFNIPKCQTTSKKFPPNHCVSSGNLLSPLNPGNIADLHKKTRDIMPRWTEGLNFKCSNNLDVNKALTFKWLMGNSTPCGFRIGGMICRKDKINNLTVSCG